MSVGFVIEAERSAHARRSVAESGRLAGTGMAGWIRFLVAHVHARRLLRRTLRRPDQIRLDEMPAYLKRDLGLPPDL